MENTIRLDEIIDVEWQLDHIIQDYNDGFSKRYTEYHYLKENLNKKISHEESDIDVLNHLIGVAKANIVTNKGHIETCNKIIAQCNQCIAQLQSRRAACSPATVYTTDENGNECIDESATRARQAEIDAIDREISSYENRKDDQLREIHKRKAYISELEGMIAAMGETIQCKKDLIKLINDDLDMLYEKFSKFQSDCNHDIAKLKDILFYTKKAEKQISFYGWHMNRISYDGSLSVYFSEVNTFRVTSKDLMMEMNNLIIFVKLEKDLLEELNKKKEIYSHQMDSKDPVTVAAVKITDNSIKNLKRIVEYYEQYCELLKRAAEQLSIYERISV